MKKNTVPFALALLILAVILSACAPAASPSALRGYAENVAPAASDQAKAGSAPEVAAAPENPEPIQRLVIRNANLSIVVKDPGNAMSTISKMAEEMGGYVVSSSLSKYTTPEGIDVPQAQVNIRVPAEKLDEAMGKIKALVENGTTDVLNENITGQDVTKDYTDQKSRLTNLEVAEKQLQKIMDETTKTDDVLAVYNQLIAIRGEIEITKGQIKFYEESAALSSISVSLTAQASIQPVTIAGWQPVGVARDAVQSLIKALQFLANAAIWLVLFFAPIGVVLFLFFLILKFFFRKVFKPRAKVTAPPTTPTPPQK